MGKRMGVIGVGAMGGTLGAYLTRAGEDITLVDPWEDHVQAMKFNGLYLDGARGEFRVPVKTLHTSELDRLEGPLDVMFVAVKSYDTETAVRLMLPYLHGDAWVATLQNGINEERIAPLVGANRLLGCVVTFNAELVGPGHVRTLASLAQAMTPNPVGYTLGEFSVRDVTPRLEELARIMGQVALTKTTTNLLAERWSKLVTNCMANPVAGLTGLNSYDIRVHPATRRLSILLAAETVRVALAVGHRPSSLVGGLTPEELLEAGQKGQHPRVEAAFLRGTERRPDPDLLGRPSMLQDILKGRPTEIDYLNGYVVRRGGEVSVPTPVNEAVVRVVRDIEAGRLHPGLENLERLRTAARLP
ncbi:MAG: 2-dehydropantoate 2-reductase [Chloroflexi bacterium]|nr:2-dehydropantoate 2-reductase [Chloroflexota bacterium]